MIFHNLILFKYVIVLANYINNNISNLLKCSHKKMVNNSLNIEGIANLMIKILDYLTLLYYHFKYLSKSNIFIILYLFVLLLNKCCHLMMELNI